MERSNSIYKINTAGKVAIGGGGVTLLGVLEELIRRRKIRIKQLEEGKDTRKYIKVLTIE